MRWEDRKATEGVAFGVVPEDTDIKASGVFRRHPAIVTYVPLITAEGLTM